MLRHSRARKNLSHAPKMLTTPLIKHVLEGSWLTKKAVLGQIATRKCCFGSEFYRPVSLLLVVASSHRLSIFVTELLNLLLCQS